MTPRLGKGTGRLYNQKTSGHPSDCSILQISHNTEETPGDLMGLDVAMTLVKDHQLTLL